MNLQHVLLGGSVISTGLMSGLLYGWAVSVIPGTRRIPADAYVDTMQNINRAIINPAFVIPFMGIPAVLGVAAYLQFRAGDHRRAWLLTGAAATYVIGVLGITMGGNVPLNDSLDGFDLVRATGDAIEQRRSSYETPWNRWHQLRTAASVGAFVLASIAAMAPMHAD